VGVVGHGSERHLGGRIGGPRGYILHLALIVARGGLPWSRVAARMQPEPRRRKLARARGGFFQAPTRFDLAARFRIWNACRRWREVALGGRSAPRLPHVSSPSDLVGASESPATATRSRRRTGGVTRRDEVVRSR
jgi:hypothetical protein